MQIEPVLCWDSNASNSHLTFTYNNISVHRVGNVSSYPAVFAKFTAAICSLTILLENAPVSANGFSFGVAKTGCITLEGGPGVGTKVGSYGIYDADRRDKAQLTDVLAGSVSLGKFRKLVTGDILRAVVNIPEESVHLFLNDTEWDFKFEVCGLNDNYVFTITLASDHKISIR